MAVTWLGCGARCEIEESGKNLTQRFRDTVQSTIALLILVTSLIGLSQVLHSKVRDVSSLTLQVPRRSPAAVTAPRLAISGLRLIFRILL